jgi:hypothetical protein
MHHSLSYIQNFRTLIRPKRADGVAHVVECLPSKCEALSSSPSTAKKKVRQIFIKEKGG